MRDAVYVPCPSGTARLQLCDAPCPRPDPDDDTLAIVEHGRAERPRWLTVRLTAPPSGAAPTLAIAAHRIGWLRPSVLQQSLRESGRTVWGDVSALAAVPAWRPDQIDPRDALDEIAAAEWVAPNGTAAVEHAVAALLLARRAYTAVPEKQASALARAWPELAGEPDAGSAGVFVRTARDLLSAWLFEWDRVRVRPKARRAFEALRARSRWDGAA
ncbi:MAG TPA: hypothetical protein VFX49_04810 [Chloroflexota bacterium]|nr:hypothetical protein [Chloroflexota bacterium]